MKRLLVFLIIAVAVAITVFRLYPHLLQGTPVERFVNRSSPVYQWQDAAGNWHVADRPPPGDVPYEVKRFPLDANVLPSSSRQGEGD